MPTLSISVSVLHLRLSGIHSIRCVSASDPQRVWEEYSRILYDSYNHSVLLWDIKELLQSRLQRLYLQTGELSEGPSVCTEVIQDGC